jgi:hypothetical protein
MISSQFIQLHISWQTTDLIPKKMRGQHILRPAASQQWRQPSLPTLQPIQYVFANDASACPPAETELLLVVLGDRFKGRDSLARSH